MEMNRQKVLVIDDEANVCELVTLYFEKAGYEMFHHGGQEAANAERGARNGDAEFGISYARHSRLAGTLLTSAASASPDTF